MMDITPKKRASIVALKEHGGLSIRQISEKMKVAKSTVGNILKRKEDTGESSTLRRGRCGRKRKTTPHDNEVIITNSMKDPKKTSVDLQRDLASAGVNISSSTVRRRLLEVGRFARKPLNKQLLKTSRESSSSDMTGLSLFTEATVSLLNLEQKHLTSSFAELHGLSTGGLERCWEQMMSVTVWQDDKKGMGMLPLDALVIEDNPLNHLWIKEEAETNKFEPAIKEEPQLCDELESSEDTKL